MNDRYSELMDELWLMVMNDHNPYYELGQVKSWGVYCYDKHGRNFDIMADDVEFYGEPFELDEGFMSILNEIQDKLWEIQCIVK